jgi:hypothetical protein
MSMRFVSLKYPNGKPVCAPMVVALEDGAYPHTDIEYEEAALKLAIRDGLLKSRREAIAIVQGQRFRS